MPTQSQNSQEKAAADAVAAADDDEKLRMEGITQCKPDAAAGPVQRAAAAQRQTGDMCPV